MTLVALVAVIGVFLIRRFFAPSAFIALKNSVEERDPFLGEERNSYGRALILLLDGTDVYCANDKVPVPGLEDYVIKTMELNSVKQVVLASSIATRYGDFVSFADRLRKRGIRVQIISTRATSPGTRLPLLCR